jgi:hypothetical protein
MAPSNRNKDHAGAGRAEYDAHLGRVKDKLEAELSVPTRPSENTPPGRRRSSKRPRTSSRRALARPKTASPTTTFGDRSGCSESRLPQAVADLALPCQHSGVVLGSDTEP